MRYGRPGTLAVRTVNDYRRRDVIGFLGVRYYLDSSASRSDQWARHVATSLAMAKSNHSYFIARHYKDLKGHSEIEHRPLFIPGPNECVAEEVILAECAKHMRVFGNPGCVYSYNLSRPTSRSGAYLPYTEGLRRRQVDVAKACECAPSGFVSYTDIKKFYPNVTADLAKSAWLRHCKIAEFPIDLMNLGERLIDGHGGSGLQVKPAILTGSMFSHLLANLVLRDIDQDFSNKMPNAYFRYVDDIALVGSKSEIARGLDAIKRRLSSLGLELHDQGSPKNLEVSCEEWLPSRFDFTHDADPKSWMRLVSNLKRFLMQNPEQRESLQDALIQKGFRIPIRDYSMSVRDPDFVSRIRQLALFRWFRQSTRSISLNSIVELAGELRSQLDVELQHLLHQATELTGYARKRRLSKLRFCIARLVYLASEDRLLSFSTAVASMPELYFHAEVMKAVASRRIDRILEMGTNAAQSVAQPLRACGADVYFEHAMSDETMAQSLAVFLVNGVPVRSPKGEPTLNAELIRFADSGADRDLMKSNDAFVREVACLHGLTDKPRHTGLFETAFDEDETLAMDAVMQLQHSVS